MMIFFSIPGGKDENLFLGVFKLMMSIGFAITNNGHDRGIMAVN
jgi:hypothetical protein